MKFFFPLLFFAFMIFRIHYYYQQPKDQVNQLTVERMEIEWERQGQQIHFKLSAPTNGWLAIGFNHEDNILHADLKMWRIKDGKAEAKDLYVVGLGNPKSDQLLGGEYSISNLLGEETGQSTQISCTIDFSSKHYSDANLDFSKPLWLIAAYSVSDDFGHHSIMRKHVKVNFSK